MGNNIHNDNSAGVKVLLLAGVILRLLGFIIVGVFLTRITLSVFTNINFAEIESFIEGLEDKQRARHLLLFMQSLNAFYTFFFLPILYIFLFKKDYLKVFNFSSPKVYQFIFIAIGILFTLMPLISLLVEWNSSLVLPERFSDLQAELLKLEERAERLTKLMIFFEENYEILPIIVVIAVLPAIGEELLFRGIIQNELKDILKNPHVSIWLTGILFSFIHFQFFGFLPRTVLGVLFGYLYYWSGNLLVPIIAHFINNAFTFIIMNLDRVKESEPKPEDPTHPATILLFTTIAVILIIYYLKLYKGHIKTHEQ